MKIFSFFSGCGFLDLGFENSGYEIDFVNEFHAPFLEAYQFARQQIGMRLPLYGYWANDINDFLLADNHTLIEYIEATRMNNNDLIGFIGGPPCPDFSIAGTNLGRHGENGRLSLSYTQLIVNQQPDFFLFENVKGLWRTARHREFYEELKTMFHNAGFVTTERLTNALEFGVPQDRDRIIMIGIRRELLDEDFITNNEVNNFPWGSHIEYSLEEIKGLPWPTTTPFGSNVPMPENLPENLMVQHWFDRNDVEHHLNSQDFFNPRTGLERMQLVDEGDVSRKSYKRLHRWRYSPTAAYGNNEVHLHPFYARRISAAEALSLQSLPAEFVLPPDMSLSNKFKTIGNGVPYLMALGIAQTLQEYLNQNVLR